MRACRVAVVLLLAGCPVPADTPQSDDDDLTGEDDASTGETMGSATSGGTFPGTSATAPSTSVTTCATDCGSTDAPTSDTDAPPAVEGVCDDEFDDDGDGAVDCYDADCWSAQVCTDRFVRVATWNVRNVGAIGSASFDKLRAVLERLDADIVCLQEVADDEGSEFDELASAAGYAERALAPSEGGVVGSIRNGCMSRHEIVQWDAVDEGELSSDAFASDMTRAILRIRVYIPAVDRYLTVLNAHLKAGTDNVDQFRRMVEAIRLGAAIDLERSTYPDNAVIALGDFNEEPDYPQGLSWSSPPPGLPFSYALGSDIALPLNYAPFAPMESRGVAVVDATVEDSSFADTYLPGLIRLDYIYEDAGDVVVSEVYEACEDDGIDNPPLGDRMPKAGDPLRCGTNGDASDHRPVVAVFYF